VRCWVNISVRSLDILIAVFLLCPYRSNGMIPQIVTVLFLPHPFLIIHFFVFAVYLMVLSASQIHNVEMVLLIVNNESESIQGKEVAAYWRYFYTICLERLRNSTKILNITSVLPGIRPIGAGMVTA
jgi:hypothetical protein